MQSLPKHTAGSMLPQNASSGLDRFCGDIFWDPSVSYNTTDPDLTECFLHTVGVWVPCLFLIGLTPLQAYFCYSSKEKATLKRSMLYYAKLAIPAVLTILSLILLFYEISVQNPANVFFVYPALLTLSMVDSAALTYYTHQRGLVTSGVQFISWFLFAFFGTAEFQWWFRHDRYMFDSVRFGVFVLYYPLVLIQFILNWFAEKKAIKASEKECPEQETSFWNILTFGWFTSLAVKAWRNPLTQSDLWNLNERDRAEELEKLWEKHWDTKAGRFMRNRKGTSEPSVIWALFKVSLPLILPGFLFKIFNDTVQFVKPYLLQYLIGFIRDKNAPVWQGYFYAVLLFVVSQLISFDIHQYFHRMFTAGQWWMTILTSAVYKKSLKLSNSARKERTVGQIVTLMSVDTQRFQQFTPNIAIIFSIPVQATLALIFLWQKLGASVLAGVAILVLLIPFNFFMMRHTRRLQAKQMKLKDQRLKLLNEVLSGIKVVKLYAWEPSFEKLIKDIRAHELHYLRRTAIWNSFYFLIWNIAPFLVALASFAAFVISDPVHHILTPETTFVSISLLNILRFPIVQLPNIIQNIVQLMVSHKRLRGYLLAEEIDPDTLQRTASGQTNAVQIEKASFSWDLSDDTPTLRNVNLNIQTGSLVAVMGQVGAGKSSLLSAMLGELDKTTGSVSISGSVAYVPQQAWIQNMTLKDNILFGKPYEHTKYQKICEACALTPDFKILPAGDMTEIGEKGINLSGGQKQRISLARAIYQNVDVYFLDDPLSAVDSHVGKHIFEQVIGPQGLLAKKTRILVTHSVNYLPQVDEIIVMKDGEITEKGSLSTLLKEDRDFADFLRSYASEQNEEETENDDNRPILMTSLSKISEIESGKKVEETKEQNSKGKLTTTETAEKGKVAFRVYSQYFKAIGIAVTLTFLSIYVIGAGFTVGTNVYLAEWSNDEYYAQQENRSTKRSNSASLGIYATLGFGQGISLFMSMLIMMLGMVVASATLHEGLVRNLMRSPMSFFDVTPLGRVINRLGKDIDSVDTIIPVKIRQFLNCCQSVVATIIIVVYSTPYLAIGLLPLAVIYYLVLRFFINTSRQLQRLNAVSRSPIFSHFQETIQGASSIRAYQAEGRFCGEINQLVDRNMACYYPNISANRWLGIRLEFLGNILVFLAAFCAVIAKEHDAISPGIAGLSITYALSVTGNLNWIVRMTSDVESNIVAVERIKEYSETPNEASWKGRKGPGSKWPKRGTVEFKNYETRYRPELGPVLKNMNLRVPHGSKLGIVGRTGAGKSSFALALFRILEPSGGQILIDGKDISLLGLHDLRTKLTIIPQDPVLFAGTLKLNLDPFSKHSDAELWTALEISHLKQFVSSSTDKLNLRISEGGENLSVGQRQLLCLARALLRKSKILVLDEATAAVDLESDELIQATIRKEFASATVITIAHRINTIIDYDRIAVLEKGEMVEYGSPSALMKDQKSLFYSMAIAAGLISDTM